MLSGYRTLNEDQDHMQGFRLHNCNQEISIPEIAIDGLLIKQLLYIFAIKISIAMSHFVIALQLGWRCFYVKKDFNSFWYQKCVLQEPLF